MVEIMGAAIQIAALVVIVTYLGAVAVRVHAVMRK